jgi:hypothetical protein
MNAERDRLYASLKNGQNHSPQAQNFIPKKPGEGEKVIFFSFLIYSV